MASHFLFIDCGQFMALPLTLKKANSWLPPWGYLTTCNLTNTSRKQYSNNSSLFIWWTRLLSASSPVKLRKISIINLRVWPRTGFVQHLARRNSITGFGKSQNITQRLLCEWTCFSTSCHLVIWWFEALSRSNFSVIHFHFLRSIRNYIMSTFKDVTVDFLTNEMKLFG